MNVRISHCTGGPQVGPRFLFVQVRPDSVSIITILMFVLIFLAAGGLIAVTYDPVYANKDTVLLFDHLEANADELWIDRDRMGLKDHEFYDGIKTGVFLYGTMPWSDDLNTDASVLMVKTGKSLDREVKESIDAFEEAAKENGMYAEVLYHENGYKYFDITEQPHEMWEYGVDKSFTEDCDIVKEVVRFLREKLGVEPTST